MASMPRRPARRPRRPTSITKPSGSIHPRVQEVGPEHFGVVAVDRAKARSKWMLTDFYGNIITPPTTVEHTRRGLDDFTARIRRAMTDCDLRDLIVAIERTGNYHLPAKRAVTAAGLEARVVHPLASRQFRLPADPGTTTDDTDLFAIRRAAVNGFGLIEPALDETRARLRLLARHRRDLVRKNADLRDPIPVELDALLPGLSAAVGGLFDHEPALVVARRLGSAAAVRARGPDGLAALLDAEGVPYRLATLKKILAWAERAPEAPECPDAHRRIFTHLDDERRARLRAIRALESDLASLLVRTPDAPLLSFPGINVVTAAEFAGAMGPIANAPRDNAITGRAGIYPARYRSDEVDRTGPLVSRADRALRYVILLIAEDLLKCNAYSLGPGETWRAAGAGYRAVVVRAAQRSCRIAHQMVAGRQVFRQPSCRERHYILEKLSIFYTEHETPLDRVLRDLHEAINWLPPGEYAAGAERLRAGLPPARRPAAARPRPAARPPVSAGRPRGPRPLSAILPGLLLRSGVTMGQSSASGEADPPGPPTASGPHNASRPRGGWTPSKKAWRPVGSPERLMRQRGDLP
jgi:transposase